MGRIRKPWIAADSTWLKVVRSFLEIVRRHWRAEDFSRGGEGNTAAGQNLRSWHIDPQELPNNPKSLTSGLLCSSERAGKWWNCILSETYHRYCRRGGKGRGMMCVSGPRLENQDAAVTWSTPWASKPELHKMCCAENSSQRLRLLALPSLEIPELHKHQHAENTAWLNVKQPAALAKLIRKTVI